MVRDAGTSVGKGFAFALFRTKVRAALHMLPVVQGRHHQGMQVAVWAHRY